MDSLYAPTTPDVEWLSDAGEKGWVVLTRDGMIQKNTIERLAVSHAKVRLFAAVSRTDLKGEQWGSVLLAWAPHIWRISASRKGPFIFRVYRNQPPVLFEDYSQHDRVPSKFRPDAPKKLMAEAARAKAEIKSWTF